MVLTVKENGEIKARLVAKGFRQRAGENYFQTFSPVVDRTSVNTLINIAAIKGLPLYSLDISQAFLQAPIDEDVYITYDGEIYKLKKALYGTKQASRMWNKEITKALKSYGMEQTKTDPCVFVKYEQPRSKFEKPQPQVFVCVSTDFYVNLTEQRLIAFKTYFRIQYINGIRIISVEDKTSSKSIEQHMPWRIHSSGIMPSGSQVHKRLTIRDRLPAKANHHVYR